MKKYYRVKKDTFLWVAGAIISNTGGNTPGTGYLPIEDIWDKVPPGTEYITDKIIEHPDNAEWFERVYPDTLNGKLFYTRDKIIEMYQSAFK